MSTPLKLPERPPLLRLREEFLVKEQPHFDEIRKNFESSRDSTIIEEDYFRSTEAITLLVKKGDT